MVGLVDLGGPQQTGMKPEVQRRSGRSGPSGGKVKSEPSAASTPGDATRAGEAARIGRTGGFTHAGFSGINTATVFQPFDCPVRTDYSNKLIPPPLYLVLEVDNFSLEGVRSAASMGDGG